MLVIQFFTNTFDLFCKIIGIIADFIRKACAKKKLAKVHTEQELEWLSFKKLILLEDDMRDNINDFAEKVKSIGEELDYKHGKELVALQDEYSRLYGIDFNYVKLSDLGIPRERLARFREEALLRVKETRWQRFVGFVRPKYIAIRIRLDEWFGDDDDGIHI
jgi:hypothetical protein